MRRTWIGEIDRAGCGSVRCVDSNDALDRLADCDGLIGPLIKGPGTGGRTDRPNNSPGGDDGGGIKSVPHSTQNRTVGPMSAPQFGHRRLDPTLVNGRGRYDRSGVETKPTFWVRSVPHSTQNRALSPTSLPHTGHMRLVLTIMDAPDDEATFRSNEH